MSPWPVLASAAAIGLSPSGPAVLYIYTFVHGEQFVQFSSFQRCEAFRRQLEAEWEWRTRAQLGITDVAQPTPKPSPTTASSARCVPG